jgi:hypothetical protein
MNSVMAGLVPLTIEAYLDKRCFTLRDLVLTCLLYGVTAVTCNYMYIYFSLWFGDGVDMGTVLTKMILDQFVYMAFWSMPIFSFGFHLQKVNYNFKEWLTIKSVREVFPLKYATNMISAWM